MSAFSSFFKRNSTTSNSNPSSPTFSQKTSSRPTSPESPKKFNSIRRSKQKDSVSSLSLSQQSDLELNSTSPSASRIIAPLDPSSLPSIDVQSPSPLLEDPPKVLPSSSTTATSSFFSSPPISSSTSAAFPQNNFFPDSNHKLTAEPISTPSISTSTSTSNSTPANGMAKRPSSSGVNNGPTGSTPSNNQISSPSSSSKPTRRGSRHGQEDSQAAPNRHELMRRAMAEAMNSANDHDQQPLISSNDGQANGNGNVGGMSHSVSGPSMVGFGNYQLGGGGGSKPTPGQVARRPSSSGATGSARKSISNGPNTAKDGSPKEGEEAAIPQLDKPGEGSLTIDAFSVDGTDTALVDGAPQPVVWPSNSESRGSYAAGNNLPQNYSTPRRPELSSRNSSFSGPSGGNPSPNNNNSNGKSGDKSSTNLETSTPKTDSGGFSKSPSASPSQHSRYATTMSNVDSRTLIGKSGSLAPPVLSNGTGPNLSPTSTPSKRTQGMTESSSTSALLIAPPSPGALARFRRNSNSDLIEGSSKKKDKKDKDIGGVGIAGALALGMNGMAGVGGGGMHSAAANVNQHLQNSKSPSNTRRKSTAGEGYQGGAYRDPSTGTVIERDDQGNDYPLNRGIERRERSTSSTSSFGNGSISGYSATSGLGAAAGFGSAIGGGFLSPDGANRPGLSRSSSSNSMRFDPKRLTPDGIGAVGGLSPSGLGEHVGILDGDFIAGGGVGNLHRMNRSNSDLSHGNGNGWDQDLGMGGQITGFAVASSKRNADFHALFSAVPEDDYLIEDYGCATVREILIQGRIYISENHVCFHANIFGWVTNVVIPFSDIVSIEKRMTAFVIPNAIQVATLHSKHTFASFLSRDTTYDLIVNIWKLSHPEINLSAADNMEFSEDDEEEDDEVVADGDGDGETETGGKKKKSKRAKLKKLLAAKEKAAGNEGGVEDDSNSKAAAGITPSKSPGPGSKKAPHRKTECACAKEKKHYNTVVLDTTYPATPEKIYNLLFTTGFMKEFWTNNQKLMDLQMSDWSPSSDSKQQLSRSITYIKPLAGGFGPKQTKCLLTDENDHVEFDDYVTVLTTTRTPDVPSGGSFSVKTRTCFTWAGGNVTKMFVSCDVTWTGRSMIKGIIDKACIDGQKQYYKDLDLAMRAYLKEHASEFKEEGDDSAAVEELAAATESNQEDSQKDNDSKAGNSSDSNDSPEGILGQVTSILKMGGGLVTDGVGMLSETLSGASPSSLIVGSIIALLVISNLWTLSYGNSSTSSSNSRDFNMNSYSDSNSLRNQRNNLINSNSRSYQQHQQHQFHDAGSPENIALAVRDVLKEFLEPVKKSIYEPFKHISHHDVDNLDPIKEARELLKLLDDAENRISRLKESLKAIEGSKVESGKAEL